MKIPNQILKFSLSLVTTMGLLLPAAAQANDQLKTIMKQMGRDYKALGPQIADPSKNASSVLLGKDISTQLKKAHDQVPDSVDALSGADHDSALLEFQNAINDVMAQVDQMVVALQANDNNTAAAILNKIAEMKKNGHDKFDPQN